MYAVRNKTMPGNGSIQFNCNLHTQYTQFIGIKIDCMRSVLDMKMAENKISNRYLQSQRMIFVYN